MSDVLIFAVGFGSLLLMTQIEPVRGWWRDLCSEPYMLTFVLPLFILFGWPREEFLVFYEGQELDWLRISRIIFFVFYAVFLMHSLGRRFFMPRTKVFFFYLIYIALCFLSAFYSPEPWQTLWKSFELFVVFLLGIQLYQNSENPLLRGSRLANAMMYLVFGICLMSLVGGMLAPDRAWQHEDVLGSLVPSMSGVVPMVHPNTLGQFAGIVALVGFYRLMMKDMACFVGDMLITIIGIVTLVLAYSRTALIGFVFICIVLMILRKRVDLFLMVVSIGTIIACLFSDSLFSWLARGQDWEFFLSLSGRTLMWEVALLSFWENPMLGHGYFVGHKYVELNQGFLATTDNTYIETMVNLGVVGLVLIVFLAVAMLCQAVRSLREYRNMPWHFRLSSITIFVFVSFTIIRSVTASSFQVLNYNLVFFILAGVVLALTDRGIRKCSTEKQ